MSLLFAGCVNVNDVKPSQPTKNVFQDEDRYVMFGLEAERLEDYNSSAALFYTTYEQTDKSEYLYRSLQGLLSAHHYDLLLSYARKYQSKYADNSMLKRYEILALVNLNRVQEAQSKAISLAETTKEPSDAILLSDIYIKEKDLQAALEYLQKAYKRDYNEKILDRIATLLYVNLHKKQEAIDALETHNGYDNLLKFVSFFNCFFDTHKA